MGNRDMPKASQGGGGTVRSQTGVVALTAIGFALFLIFDTLTLWGGLSIGSFFELDVPGVIGSWSVIQATCMTLTFLAGALAARRTFNRLLIRGAVVLAAASGLAGCWFLAQPSLSSMAALVASASLFGVSNGLFYLLWEQAMASLPEHATFKIILAATAVFPVTYFCMRSASTALLAMGASVALASGVLLMAVLSDRFGIRPDPAGGPASPDVSGKSPDGVLCHRSDARTSTDYRAALHIMRGSIACVGAIGLVVSITRSLALFLVPDYNAVGTYALVGAVVSAVLLIAIWFGFKKPFDLPTFYKMAFPVAITTLLLMSFAPAAWANPISAFFYFLFTMVSSLIMLSGVQVARSTGTEPVFCFGILAASCYLMVALGAVLSTFRSVFGDGSQSSTLLAVLLCVYLLSLVAASVSNRRFDSSFIVGGTGFRSGGLRPQEAAPSSQAVSAAAVGPGTPSVHAEDVGLQLLARRCGIIAATYMLSARESEVMACMIRGYDVRRIAHELYISENTVRYHSKNIYRKLNVHSKQEVLAIYESV
jgi:DNA-binding CsgD family transcriptional regulator